MRSNILGMTSVGVIAGSLLAGVAGCQPDRSPPPRMGPLVDRDGPRVSRDPVKPLPDPRRAELPPPPFDDVPLVNQRLPEQNSFLDAYTHVGRPRIAIFVNRTLQGDIIPVNDRQPLVGIEQRGNVSGDIRVERRDYRDRTDRFESKGPGEYRQTTEVYLRPGQYDEIAAKQIDYATIENVLTQWLSADGQATIVSPSAIRERLTEDEIRKLQEGRPRVLGEIAKELNTQILVQVQARPTRQTESGLEVRLNAEAINVQGGESIARATVLIPPPLDTEKVNKFTRFVSRRLMDGMTATWAGPGGEPPGAAPTAPAGPPPALPPPGPPPPGPTEGVGPIPGERPSILDRRPESVPVPPDAPLPGR